MTTVKTDPGQTHVSMRGPVSWARPSTRRTRPDHHGPLTAPCCVLPVPTPVWSLSLPNRPSGSEGCPRWLCMSTWAAQSVPGSDILGMEGEGAAPDIALEKVCYEGGPWRRWSVSGTTVGGELGFAGEGRDRQS